MALTVKYLRDDAWPPAVAFVTPIALCLDETKARVVPCDSTEARYQLAGAGCEVSVVDAQRYGLKSPGAAEKALAARPKTRPPRTKAQRPADDK